MGLIKSDNRSEQIEQNKMHEKNMEKYFSSVQ